uniref:Protein yippee-like n=1 Tax=Gasterosteus aculeatus aculeatus TaxID=481459 RepID=A0AAQ4NWE3_GASAC
SRLRPDRMTLHCQQCSAVWGDSFSICGEVRSMDSIVCLSEFISLLGCRGWNCTSCLTIYSALKCRGCCCAVGKVIHSAPWRLASVRSMFLLHKANTSCILSSLMQGYCCLHERLLYECCPSYKVLD